MSRIEERRAGESRIVRRQEDDGAFDREFWHSVPPDVRLASVWEMVLDVLLLKVPHEAESRLQRSVCRLERRGG